MARNKGKSTVTVDFSRVERIANLDPGEYRVTVDSASLEEGEKGQYIKLYYKTEQGKLQRDNLSLSPKALWRLANFMEAIGLETADEVELDISTFIGETLGIETDTEEYNGKERSVVIGYLTEKELGDTDDEDDEETEEDDDDEDDEDELTPEDIEEMDDEELNDAIEERDLPSALKSKSAKTKRKAILKSLSKV